MTKISLNNDAKYGTNKYMDQLKRTKDGFFEIVDKNSPHGKVWFNNPKNHSRIVNSSRTAFIIYQISSWWGKQGKESIPWDY